MRSDDYLREVVRQRCYCIECHLRALSERMPFLIFRLNQIAEIGSNASRDPDQADSDSQQFLKALLVETDGEGKELIPTEAAEHFLGCEDPTQAIRRAAHHEAGHIIVAAKKSIRLPRGIAMGIDACGYGKSFIRLRLPGDGASYPISREDSIVVLLAGGFAELESDPLSSGKSASDDLKRIRELQAEDPPLSDISGLQTESRELVEEHSATTKNLAKELLLEKYERRREREDWSDCSVARYLSGEQVKKVLPDSMSVMLWGPSLTD